MDSRISYQVGVIFLALGSFTSTLGVLMFPDSISLLSLKDAAWMGIPVQWKEKGKRTFFPCCFWYLVENSDLDSEKA